MIYFLSLTYRAFDVNADVDLFGVREVLAIENEKQSNGKTLKKVIDFSCRNTYESKSL